MSDILKNNDNIAAAAEIIHKIDDSAQRSKRRIVCLLPAATDICIALGLQDDIVGITHECCHSAFNDTVVVLTSDAIQGTNGCPPTQYEIHQAIVKQQQQQQNLCSIDVPSLYPIDKQLLVDCQPTIIFTQDLCAVCAPSSTVVESMIPMGNTGTSVRIISLTPHTLQDVAATFIQVAEACGIKEKGIALQNEFLQRFQMIQDIIISSTSQPRKLRMLLLEWLDPPFDAGHWIPELMKYANLEPVNFDPTTTNTATNVISKNNDDSDDPEVPKKKSIAISWDDIKKYGNPIDVVIVSCCGFQLQRNYNDALQWKHKICDSCFPSSDPLKVYAINADRYIVNPNPKLVLGCVLLALLAYQDNDAVVNALYNLPFVPPMDEMNKEWKQVIVDGVDHPVVTSKADAPAAVASTGKVADIEDLINSVGDSESQQHHDVKDDWDHVHNEACKAGKHTYIDPSTGYSVFTEFAHKKRGKCCGSGCRHCPYNHVNVAADKKAAKIQQPAFLYNNTDDDDNLFDIYGSDCTDVYVLFFSGGKDSFLGIRAMVRKYKEQQKKFGLILLTTFDAPSRIVAHQDIPIDHVVKQATYLNISLLGVPLHRGVMHQNYYVNRVQLGLECIQSEIGASKTIKALVFADLHLQHIYQWRNDNIGALGYELMYPLFNMDYKILERDLNASQVPCQITSSNAIIDDEGNTDPSSAVVTVGEYYTDEFRRNLETNHPSIDLFGENGEFHTLAKVWEVPRQVALGLSS